MINNDWIDYDALRSFGEGKSGDAWQHFGCHFIPELDSYRFIVWAPKAQRVSVVGDFNGWSWDANVMERLDCGAWCAFLKNAWHGSIYKYGIVGADGNGVLKADPFATHAETGPATGSKVWRLEGFAWQDDEFLNKRKETDPYSAPMSIYEVHLGSWKREKDVMYPNYREAADQLAEYCGDMGYTHIELMPVTEYPFEGSWGYQVTGYFAPTSRYGTPEDFMYFVNRMHMAGIGVLMDWVPAHFPRDEHGLAWFDGTPVFERDDPKMASHPDWGTLIFDYGKPVVKSFLTSSAACFVERYHIDGLRVDGVSAMLYLGYGRGNNFTRNRFGGDIDLGAIELLQQMNVLVRGLGAVTIAEESAAYPRVTEPAENGGLGFTFKWNMGYMLDTLDYFELDPLFRRGSHQKLTFSMMNAFSEHYILAFSHDEVVHGKKSMVDKMYGSYDEKFANLRTLYAYQFAHPGKKLTFMGSEFAQFIEWTYKRQLDWFLLAYPRHVEMQRWCRELNHFYTDNTAFYENDGGWDGFQWLNVNDEDRSSIAFMRKSKKEKVVCVFNFTPQEWELQIGLPAAGKLSLILNSDEYRFGGTGSKAKKTVKSSDTPFQEFEHSALISLPPLSAMYYLFKELT